MTIVQRLAVAMGMLAAPLEAQLSPAEKGWNVLARADVAAALQLIEENHPGASPQLGDLDFQRRLAAARALANQRLPLVKDYGGHAAIISGVANAFGDGHIASSALLTRGRRTWAGLVVTRTGGRWLIGGQDAQPGEPDLKGARLVACDGREADQMARELIGGFYTDPGNEAGMIGYAPNLLLDHNNPFVARPKRCRFETPAGASVDHVLRWRPALLATVEKLIVQVVPRPRAGMGVSRFAGGHWIALETLSNAATAVVGEVRAQEAALRAAPMVVLDLRGNSGGNSQYADEIARVLVGGARFAAVNNGTSRCEGMYWRVSRDNSLALRRFARDLPADRAAQWLAQADALETAVPAGALFSPALPACARQDGRAAPPMPSRLPPPAMRGRLILLTDRTCFSSCLMATSLFRRLGALHVGEATDMGTRYMEVRTIKLPSGLRTFSTMQKVALGMGDFGPYAPATVYPGRLDEEEKLKAWVAALPR